MTPHLLHARHFIYSFVKQPDVSQRSAARILWRAPGSPVFLFSPDVPRGRWSTAWRNHHSSAPCGAGGSGDDPRAPRRSTAVSSGPGHAFGKVSKTHAVSQLLAGGPSAPGRSPASPENGGCVLSPARRHRIADVGFTRYRPRKGGPAVMTPHESALGEPDAGDDKGAQARGDKFLFDAVSRGLVASPVTTGLRLLLCERDSRCYMSCMDQKRTFAVVLEFENA